MDITYRPGTPQDSRTVFDVFIRGWSEVARRMGATDADKALTDPDTLARQWDTFQPLYGYLATCADQYWVAEQNGHIVGYARSTLDDGVRELTEFFVSPDSQSAGIGRTLLARAFPVEGARRRAIMATPDIRAQALYLRAGVYPRFAINFLSRKPEPVRTQSDLVFRPVTSSPDTLTALRTVDKTVLGFERDAKHEVFLRIRKAYLYYRRDQLVGYGYLGGTIGPMALLDDSDYPAVLAHAENDAAERGDDMFGMSVPDQPRSGGLSSGAEVSAGWFRSAIHE